MGEKERGKQREIFLAVQGEFLGRILHLAHDFLGPEKIQKMWKKTARAAQSVPHRLQGKVGEQDREAQTKKRVHYSDSPQTG